MASLHDRLGGHVMKWSNLKGQQWGGATLPLFHEGEFYNIEVKVSESKKMPLVYEHLSWCKLLPHSFYYNLCWLYLLWYASVDMINNESSFKITNVCDYFLGKTTLSFWISFQIDQSVFTVCPPRPDIRPGMVLVFELFLLRGAVTPTDRVVAWGCFPICDSNFRVVEGK